jgi:hypothetical protein
MAKAGTHTNIKTMEAMTTAGLFVIRLSRKTLKPVAKAC